MIELMSFEVLETRVSFVTTGSITDVMFFTHRMVAGHFDYKSLFSEEMNLGLWVNSRVLEVGSSQRVFRRIRLSNSLRLNLVTRFKLKYVNMQKEKGRN